jgi:SsrA-binding protein
MYVGEYTYGNVNNHETRRDRRLLLKKSELLKLNKRVTEKGFTIVPYRIYLSERGFIKLEIWLAQGKKSYDKRDSIKEKDVKRDLERIKKHL